MILRILHKNRN